MDEIIPNLYFLALAFCIVAFLYSSVGLGGGSSYTALMAIIGVHYLLIPTISLTLNLIVTSIASINFLRGGHGRIRLLLPFLITSIPMAYIGGSLHFPKDIFFLLLMATLVLVALRVYVWDRPELRLNLTDSGKLAISLMTGGILGFIAGAVGIGGGIYLVPLIIVLGLGTEKEAAATGAIFIWLNSCAGLVARVGDFPDPVTIFPLVLAVIIGGAAGSSLGANKYEPRTMQKFLGGVILIAIAILFGKMVL
jgi:hypothetical protein